MEVLSSQRCNSVWEISPLRNSIYNIFLWECRNQLLSRVLLASSWHQPPSNLQAVPLDSLSIRIIERHMHLLYWAVKTQIFFNLFVRVQNSVLSRILQAQNKVSIQATSFVNPLHETNINHKESGSNPQLLPFNGQSQKQYFIQITLLFTFWYKLHIQNV